MSPIASCTKPNEAREKLGPALLDQTMFDIPNFLPLTKGENLLSQTTLHSYPGRILL